ncbi:MAG: hypothetical protein K2N16_05390 [Muribaculaceae bacterium]|nr:hypothetical protein [Muribaculaceae bacterium]
MRLRPVYKAFVLVAAIATAIAGCNTAGCLENRNSVPLAGFYASGSGDKIQVLNIQINGLSNDTVAILEPTQRVSQVYLPMRSTKPSTSWVISYKDEALDGPEFNDTISFHYDSKPYFASEECGVIYKYHIRQVDATSHLIDSVVLADSVITNVDIEQIRIYFRVKAEEGE